MNLIIIGAGQYGYVAKETAEACGYTVRFLDDNNEEAVGRFDDWGEFNGEFFVAIGNNAVRLKLIEKLEAAGKRPVTLISPRAWVSASSIIGNGSIVESMAVVNTGTKVGKGCLICAGSIVNHNAVVGDGCLLDVNSTIEARADVPECTRVVAGQVWHEKPGMPSEYDFDAVM